MPEVPTSPPLASPSVVALIATCQRHERLRAALGSIAAQSRAPDLVIVVDDGPTGEHDVTRACVEHSDLPLARVAVLSNRRTPGAAGAWNTGFDEAARRFMDTENVFVAVLDDDDTWDADHLQTCLDAALTRALDMVAAGIVRYDAAHPDGRRQSLPTRLDAGDAFVGNPHIQGSNLFVRLARILAAGLFDEALESATDRDLLVRLADLGTVRFGAVEAWTVHHDARPGRLRLSTPGSGARLRGTQAFWRKYRTRMSIDQRTAFRARAVDLFRCHDLDATPDDPPPPKRPLTPCAGDPLALVVGIIADADAAGASRVAPLLEDLLALSGDPDLASLAVVIVENGVVPEGQPLRHTAAAFRARGLELYLATAERQHADAAAGVFGAGFSRPAGRAGIGAARTMVQRYVHDIAASRDAVAWILDDDKRLDPLVRGREGRLRRERLAIVPTLRALRAEGVAVALGVDTGAAPLPALATMRVQLVDVAHHLTTLAAFGPDARWPDRASDNFLTAARFPDYYYDLARGHTAHLETPCWLALATEDDSAREVFLRLAAHVPRALAGEAITRPLYFDAARDGAVTPSWYRGGSTFVFDLGALHDVPNAVPDLDGRETRRSDMLWCALNACCRGRRVVRAPLAVYHDRSDLPARDLDLARAADDIRGYALLRVLEDLFARRARGGADDLVFSPDELRFAQLRYPKYLEERAAALRLSFHRARGACVSAARTLRDPSAWWNADDATRDAAAGLASALDELAGRLDAAALARVLGELHDTDGARIADYLATLRQRLRNHATGSMNERSPLFEMDRRESARAIVAQQFGGGRLRLLGEGDEGVCLTDEERIFKVFDGGASGDAGPSIAAVRELIGRWKHTRGLIPLCELRAVGRRAVLVYGYGPSDPYAGGYGPGLVRLLRECRAQGVVCRNLHPENLRVFGDDVRLIDYGRDVEPWSDEGWRHMLRRAWLSWRWPHLRSLRTLMRRALREDIPELDGWERLRHAVEAAGDRGALDGLLERLIRQNLPAALLDYGCGKARLAAQLSASGVRTVAYDPALPEGASAHPALTLTGDRTTALGSAPFDAVLCSLVLCVLDDDAYRAALADLRAALRAGGRAYIAVCNPFFTLGGPTPLQSREVPPWGREGDSFVWEKVLHASGVRRRDVHRPFTRLCRDLRRSGFFVEEVHATETVDLERFEPASDFLVLVARAVPEAPSVSLLIRACAQEAGTLDAQVRHLVEQLEAPRTFAERVLVLDSRREEFLRAYGLGAHGMMVAVARQLAKEGVVDRVVLAPSESREVEALHARWFDPPSRATHTADGTPLSVSLAGFEACASEYVLAVDADLLVVRRDRSHDYLREMIDALARDPRGLATSLNIAHADDRLWTASDRDGPWRVEVRAGLYDRARLLASRPWPNPAVDGVATRSWHRSLDEVVHRDGWRSYRGGDARTFFVHPPNTFKRDTDAWMALLDRAEDGFVPDEQLGCVDLVGGLDVWLGPARREPIVLVACGRDVPHERFLRWLESLRGQSRADWGAVVIDDGGSPETRAFLRLALAPYRDRITLLCPRQRRGGLANTVWAIRHVCRNPESIVALVDADDALLGRGALARVAAAYDAGADLTVGTMRRTDKDTEYPVDFEDPRARRGGNIWQHLRTFRRALFDEVPDSALQFDGEFVDIAWDWALMLPLVDLARRPVYIEHPVYLYEPSGEGKSGDARARREAIIARLVAKPRLWRRDR